MLVNIFLCSLKCPLKSSQWSLYNLCALEFSECRHNLKNFKLKKSEKELNVNI